MPLPEASENMSLWAAFISTNINMLCYDGSHTYAGSMLEVRVIAATSWFFRVFHRGIAKQFKNESFIGLRFFIFQSGNKAQPDSVNHRMVVPDGRRTGENNLPPIMKQYRRKKERKEA